jgi:hypothetical protein
MEKIREEIMSKSRQLYAAAKESATKRKDEQRNMSTNKPILCVDFDGVIHSYTSGWQGAAVIPDSPVDGALAWLLKASKLFDIAIYSSRSKESEGRAAMRMWLTYHARNELPRDDAEALLDNVITFAHEKPAAFLTIDDRAVCFDGDWSKLDPAKLRDFKPWNQQQAQPQPQPTQPATIIKEAIADDLAVKSVTQ